jgi:hypothetical protein
VELIFKPFAAAVAAQFALMSKHELFTVKLDGDTLYDAYLAAFPAGTNPIFRERTEHDCSCCKNFIRNIGNVVAIIDGKVVTVWDVVGEMQVAYAQVAGTLAELVRNAEIDTIYRTSEKSYGAESSKELRDDGTVKSWNHFYGKIDAKHYAPDPGAQRGVYTAAKDVFKRGLTELKKEAMELTSSLIGDKLLYRGEEHLPALLAFFKLHTKFNDLTTDVQRNVFIMSNALAPASRFRNTVIGSLIIDLSDGMPMEKAVASFEKKVAPENYKRPTALVTQKQKDDAFAAIVAMGLEDSLQRRYANITDITINNVLWANGDVKPVMKGGLANIFDTISTTADAAVVDSSMANDISIEDFMATVLPKAKGIEMLVTNRHLSNFVSLTAPTKPNTAGNNEPIPVLFKWPNDFAWSYDGNIADSALRQQVASKGGRVDGVLRFSHTWNHAERNASLMDLHVFMPGSTHSEAAGHHTNASGQRVGWDNRDDRISGGKQDVDYTEAAPVGYVPVENITFPDMARLKDGQYTFKIQNWSFRSPTLGGFKAEIEFAGQIFEYDHPKPLRNKEWVTLAVATLKDGVFTIEHKHPVGSSSQKKWGISTERMVKVDTVMLSPNHWDGNAVGNKHYMFMLADCKNPDATRGIYNEFLNPKLEVHRKVFELLGDKTQCPPVDDQLSGLGFSSTKRDSVLVVVQISEKHRKAYNIIF